MDSAHDPTVARPDATVASLKVPSEAPRWTAEQILQGEKEALIVHGEMVYRLRLTRSGKLLLFK